MDVFNPPERQHIIPPPPPVSYAASPTNNTSTLAPQQEQNNNANNNTNTNSNVTVTIDTKQMQSELERRQQELEMKAAELAAREEALRQGGGEFRRQHNWPPLPSFCPIKPCFFQDINVDIRPEFQKTVQLGYHLWIGFVFMHIINSFAAILLVSFGTAVDGSYLSFALAMLIILTPLSYVFWFRPLYKAFKNDSSFNFMIFFFVFFMQTFIVTLFALGLPARTTIGLFTAIGFSSEGFLLVLVAFATAVCWIAYVIASVFYLSRVHKIYRSSGASMAKARNEFTQGIISNQYVQQTVTNAARQTFNQTFPGPAGTSDQNLPGGVR